MVPVRVPTSGARRPRLPADVAHQGACEQTRLGHIHSVRLHNRGGGRRLQVLDEHRGDLRLPRLRAEGGREDEGLLKLVRHRSRVINARRAYQKVAHEQTEFRLAIGDGLRELRWRILSLDLGLHLLANAESVEYAEEVLAVDAFR